MAHRHSHDNPGARKPTSGNTQPPRFWKGFYTDSKDAGEMQVTLLWEQGADNKDAIIMSFLLDFWQDGVKDFFTETNNKRHIDLHLSEMRRQFAHIKLVNCTPKEARKLIQEALNVNKKQGTRPHPDFTRNLPLINELVLQAPGGEDAEEDWDEDEDALTPGSIASNPFLASAKPHFPDMLNDSLDPGALLRSFLGPVEVEPVVIDFLQAWSAGDYASAYDMLTKDSPLRDGLTRNEWVALRKQWSAEAQPTRLVTLFVEEREEDFDEDEDEDEDFDEELDDEVLVTEDEEDEDEEEENPIVEAGWSLEFTDTPLSQRIKELPTATAFLPETNRHWFWTSYTLVEDEDEDSYLIHDLTDEGGKIMGLSSEEIETRLDSFKDDVERLLQSIKEDAGEEDEEDFDEDEDEDFEDEDDEDFEDEEDEEDEDEDFLGTLTHMQQIISTVTRLNFYCDALLAKSPTDDPEIYDSAIQNASLTQDFEHVAVFLKQKAKDFPDQRGEALTLLAAAYIEVGAQAAEAENPDEEQQNRFAALAEQAAQEAIDIAKTPKAYIILAQIWIEQGKKLSEAEALLHEAERLSPDSREAAIIEVSLARLAEKRLDPALALEHYKRATQIQPDFPAIWITMGKLQRDLGQYDEAEESLRYSIETEPEEIDAYIGLAEIYMNARNDFQKAKDILEKGVEVDPESPDIYVAFTLLYMQRNDFRTAERYLEQAEMWGPDMDFVQEMRKTFDIEKAEHRRGIKTKQQHKTHKNKGHKPGKR